MLLHIAIFQVLPLWGLISLEKLSDKHGAGPVPSPLLGPFFILSSFIQSIINNATSKYGRPVVVAVGNKCVPPQGGQLQAGHYGLMGHVVPEIPSLTLLHVQLSDGRRPPLTLLYRVRPTAAGQGIVQALVSSETANLQLQFSRIRVPAEDLTLAKHPRH